MKSQVTLLNALLDDASSALRYNSSRDKQTIAHRYSHEGEGFLCVTLPQLDDLLMEGLSAGQLPSYDGWSTKRHATCPAFMAGAWLSVFDRAGKLLPNPDHVAIYWIRQVARLFKKTAGVPNAARIEASYDAFVETDRALSSVKFTHNVDLLRDVCHYAFGHVVGQLFTEELVYKHGPGSVADRLDQHERYGFKTVSSRAAEWAGYEVFRPTWELLQEPFVEREVPARLIAVPKTYTKPRLISIEPSYNQFLQQGAHSVLKRELGKIKVCGYLSQDPNRRLARSASVDGVLATVDLSEASDRVHYGLVRHVFGWSPQFKELLDATRSRVVEIEGRGELSLNKFASMGSALTFPVETMVFTGITLLSVLLSRSMQVTRTNVRKLTRANDIRIYGDDIIVPADCSAMLFRLLAEFGLKVNTKKSYTTGRFRESCGGDYYGGHDVTPVYSRRALPDTASRTAELIVSAVDLHNQLWVKNPGCRATLFLKGVLRDVSLEIPVFSMERPGVQAFSGLFLYGWEESFDMRRNPALHRNEVRAPTLIHKRRVSRATWRDNMMELLTRQHHVEDRDNLVYDGRPVSAQLKHRWLPV